MSLKGQSLHNIADLETDEVRQILERTKAFKDEFHQHKNVSALIDAAKARSQVMVLVFFEASTRTRVSFQVAGHRLGLNSVTLDSITSSSMAKGESHADTLLTMAAMEPDIIVVRSGGGQEIKNCVRELGVPVINAGSGVDAHPTQAILDAFTIQEFRGQVEGEKVLFVGDVLHSRVAGSDRNLLTRLGAHVAICSPETMTPGSKKGWEDVKNFEDLDEALRWCTVCIGLRIQKERHQREGLGLSMAKYRDKYLIDEVRLKSLRADGVLMHPGPVIREVDFASTVFADPRCRVQNQVTNGVFVRMALLSEILDLGAK